jgi:hypothetical protein
VPVAVKKLGGTDETFSNWDHPVVPAEAKTLKQFIDWVAQRCKVGVTSVTFGELLLWASFRKSDRERLGMNIKELVVAVSQKPLGPTAKFIRLAVGGNLDDSDDEPLLPEFTYTIAE